MLVSIDTWAQEGVRVRAFRGPRSGRVGTVVSVPFFGTWMDGKLVAQVSVDYDDSGGAPPLRTFVFCLVPLDAVTLLGEVADDD